MISFRDIHVKALSAEQEALTLGKFPGVVLRRAEP